jgi:hypothetical protein
MGTFTEGEPEELTGVSWISGTPGVATVSASGLVTPVAEGTTTITATKDDDEARVQFTVTTGVLTKIGIMPTAPSAAVGQTYELRAAGRFSDGRVAILESGLTWHTSDTGVATVTPDGVVTAVNLGTSLITVSSGDLQGEAIFTALPARRVVKIGLDRATEIIFHNTISAATWNPFGLEFTWIDGDIQSDPSIYDFKFVAAEINGETVPHTNFGFYIYDPNPNNHLQPLEARFCTNESTADATGAAQDYKIRFIVRHCPDGDGGSGECINGYGDIYTKSYPYRVQRKGVRRCP